MKTSSRRMPPVIIIEIWIGNNIPNPFWLRDSIYNENEIELARKRYTSIYGIKRMYLCERELLAGHYDELRYPDKGVI